MPTLAELWSKYGKRADNYLTNLSMGLGSGLTNQLEGMYQTAAHPVQTVQGLAQLAANPRALPGMARNALTDAATRASSGPLGLGEVLGEYLSPRSLMPKQAPMRNELITYHGSPHRINNVDEAHPMGRFDLSKVGTGEGAQAYGHGVYLAESPGVAKSYQRKLAGGIDGMLVDVPKARSALLDRVQKAADKLGYGSHELGELKISAAHVDRLLQDAAEGVFSNQPSKIPGALPHAFRSINRLGVKTDDLFTESKGHFYTVDLPDEKIAQMLDWDAPLSEQPESVRKALLSIKRKLPENAYADLGEDWNVLFGKDVTGEQFLNTVKLITGNYTDGAERLLREAGIPGVKYLDGGSRTAGDGTRNFVIFDGDTAKILKRE